MDVKIEEGRRFVTESALASQRLAGLEVDDESRADLDAFVAGVMSLEEVRSRALARFDRSK